MNVACLVFAALVIAASAVPVAFVFPGVPVPGLNATAIFSGSYDKATKELQIHITHTLSDASMCHIHGPVATAFTAPGSQGTVTGGPLVTISTDATTSASPISKIMTLTAAQEDALCGKLTYFNLHSSAFAGGAFGAVIYLDCDTPAIPFSFTGLGSSPSLTESVTFSGWYNPGSRVLNVEVTHSVAGITMIHLHGAAPKPYAYAGSPFAQNGGVLQTILDQGESPASPIKKIMVVDQATHNAICHKQSYFNIHTTAVAGGAYGAVLWIDCTPRASWSIDAIGIGAANTAPAVFSGSLDIDNRILSYVITHPLPDATAAHIHGPVSNAFTASGSIGTQSAGPIETLAGATDSASPIIKSMVISQSSVDAMCANKTYFALHSLTSAAGAYVAALTVFCYRSTDLPYSYTLSPSGAQTETVTVSGTYNPATRHLTSKMNFGALTDVTAVHIHGENSVSFANGGSPFTNGADAGVMLTLAGPGVTPIDTMFDVSPANATAICNKKTYFAVHTTSAPAGAFGAIFYIDCYGFPSSLTVQPDPVPTTDSASTQAPFLVALVAIAALF